jgi:hypothetical protein
MYVIGRKHLSTIVLETKDTSTSNSIGYFNSKIRNSRKAFGEQEMEILNIN